jgi:hypothetical protein
MGKLAETDRFISRANSEDTQIAAKAGTERLNQWLASLIEQKGSDLLLVPGAPPSVRFEGDVRN